jgi:ATP-dependent DNA ligase
MVINPMASARSLKPAISIQHSSRDAFDLPLETKPMEAISSESLPIDGPWQYEPKWDGFRCLAFRAGEKVDLRAKSGKPLGRYFPEVVQMLRGCPFDRFVVDGELVIEIGGKLSFDALQMRLHPAQSRVRTLAAETPSRLVLFDMLSGTSGESLIDAPLTRRRSALEAFARKAAVAKRLIVSPCVRAPQQAEEWLSKAGTGDTDGVVAKRLDLPYEPGQRTMIKVKRLRTADCVVGGFRYGSSSREVGSLLLGLFDDRGKLHHVGYTSNITNAERPALTKTLEKIIEEPGFTGKTPGGVSRWSTERSGEWQPLRNKLVVEVQFDHVTGDRFRHGTKLVRWRPDKSPQQCTLRQIKGPAAEPRTPSDTDRHQWISS